MNQDSGRIDRGLGLLRPPHHHTGHRDGLALFSRMFHSRLLAATALLCALPISSHAGLPSLSRASLTKATQYLTSISTEGGYLWRYSEDLKERWGEGRATETQIWVQPPGTPAVGGALLEAYKATGDERHLLAAEGAAQALVRGQLESGGWAYLVEFDPEKRAQWAYRVDSKIRRAESTAANDTTTFDDNNTQSALRFLMAFLDLATNRPSAELAVIREARDYGLAKMIEAQYPNGAWPQRWAGRAHDPAQHPRQKAHIPSEWPHNWPRANYSAYYTLNDSTQLDCIETMLEAFHRLGDSKYLDAAKRGGDFLILAQLPEPQPAWAQQYNFNMEPAWARAFEPPAVCTSESAVAMRTLVDLFVETGDRRYLEPIPPFLDWLKRSHLGPDRWARLYELGSNKPIYGDRDGRVHHTLAEISAERQRGYGWQGSFGIASAIEYYEAVLSKGRDAFKSTGLGLGDRGTPSGSRVTQILSGQDKAGRWLRNGWVDMRAFVVNIRALAAYLESAPAAQQP